MRSQYGVRSSAEDYYKVRYQQRKNETMGGGDPSRCICCREGKIEALSIEHINNGGARHRKEVEEGSTYSWLKKNGYQEGFPVLCFKCKCEKGIDRECPCLR